LGECFGSPMAGLDAAKTAGEIPSKDRILRRLIFTVYPRFRAYA
jgi:hypothetical protein